MPASAAALVAGRGCRRTDGGCNRHAFRRVCRPMTGELGTLAPVNRSAGRSGCTSGPPTRGARGLLEEMLGRTARGDQAAFGAVYDAMKSPVFGIVVRSFVIRRRARR